MKLYLSLSKHCTVLYSYTTDSWSSIILSFNEGIFTVFSNIFSQDLFNFMTKPITHITSIPCKPRPLSARVAAITTMQQQTFKNTTPLKQSSITLNPQLKHHWITHRDIIETPWKCIETHLRRCKMHYRSNRL